MKTLSKKEWIAVGVGLVVISIFFLSRTFIFSFLTSNTTSMNDSEQAMGAAANSTPGATSLMITDTVVGTGAEAVAGKKITVHYTGKLTNGQVFDSSVSRGEPFTFDLGANQVIQGWEQGFAGMKVGGKRTIVIPPTLGYGERGAGGVIPPNATLIFDVELLNVQ